jgi:hypothetical protein
VGAEPTREELISLNQALFRAVNERARSRGGETLRIRCECGESGCRAQLLVVAERYESVREDPRRFLIQPGHLLEDLERVVLASDDFFVVETVGPSAELAEATDPRRSERAPA